MHVCTFAMKIQQWWRWWTKPQTQYNTQPWQHLWKCTLQHKHSAKQQKSQRTTHSNTQHNTSNTSTTQHYTVENEPDECDGKTTSWRIIDFINIKDSEKHNCNKALSSAKPCWERASTWMVKITTVTTNCTDFIINILPYMYFIHYKKQFPDL